MSQGERAEVRPVRKALLVRADELCARVDRLSLMQQGEG